MAKSDVIQKCHIRAGNESRSFFAAVKAVIGEESNCRRMIHDYEARLKVISNVRMSRRSPPHRHTARPPLPRQDCHTAAHFQVPADAGTLSYLNYLNYIQ